VLGDTLNLAAKILAVSIPFLALISSAIVLFNFAVGANQL